MMLSATRVTSRLTTIGRALLASRSVSTLEVERKFKAAPNFLSEMKSLLSSEKSSVGLFNGIWKKDSMTSIRDTYYDLDHALSHKGVYIRYRTTDLLAENGKVVESSRRAGWGAKVRVGGDYIDSAFEELQGEAAVRKVLAHHAPTVQLEHLPVMADLVSIRRSWSLPKPTESSEHGDELEELSIVLDDVTAPEAGDRHFAARAEFRHQVGEVELTRMRTSTLSAAEDSLASKAEVESMRAIIKRYMDMHPELFSNDKPVGKLSAFFAWQDSVNQDKQR